MRGFTKRATSLAMVLGLGGVMVACDNTDPPATVDSGVDGGGPRDSGSDTGSEPVDSGPDEDGGPIDGGPADGGPPPAFLRLAHLIPGGPDVHVCINIPDGAATWNLITVDSVTRAPTAIPYKGVSAYTSALQLPPINVRVAVYDAADVVGGVCPTAPTDAIINQVMAGGDVNVGGTFYTIAATGLPADGTGEQVPELVIFTDDLTAPATDMTHIRFVHGIPNLPVNVDVCHDPDFTFAAGGVPVPGPMEPVELVADLAFEEASDYVARAPITTGALLVFAAAVDCTTAATAGAPTMAIPVPIPLPTGSPANYVPTFTADNVHSVFFVGNVTVTDRADPRSPSILPIQDDIGR